MPQWLKWRWWFWTYPSAKGGRVFMILGNWFYVERFGEAGDMD